MVRRWRRADAPADAASNDAASTVRMLAVLLQAGAAPAAAWRHLAEVGDPVAERVLARAGEGEGLVAAIDAEGGRWRDLAAAWEIAGIVGAPLADALRAIAEAMRDAAGAADEVRIALAEPAGTARMLLWMPLVGLLLGVGLGFDVIGVVAGSPIGAACAVAGVLLLLVARAWTRRLLRAAQPVPGTPGLHAELVAIGLSGGASLARALELVDLGHDGDASARTRDVLQMSRAAGVPAGELLRAAAAHERHQARVDGRLRAARLSSRLLVPLGVCTLPAFLLLGVAPMVLSVLSSTSLPIDLPAP